MYHVVSSSGAWLKFPSLGIKTRILGCVMLSCHAFVFRLGLHGGKICLFYCRADTSLLYFYYYHFVCILCLEVPSLVGNLNFEWIHTLLRFHY